MRKMLLLIASILQMPLIANAEHSERMAKHIIGFMIGGMLVWLLFLVVIVFIAYFAIISTKHARPLGPNNYPRNNTTHHETHLDILKKRYARGEISKEEFDRMKDDLED